MVLSKSPDIEKYSISTQEEQELSTEKNDLPDVIHFVKIIFKHQQVLNITGIEFKFVTDMIFDLFFEILFSLFNTRFFRIAT